MGSGTPITPVDATRTNPVGRSSASAARRAISAASARPASPVQALALPLLTTIACARPAEIARCVYRTGAALTRFVVKTPAADAGTSATRSARSGLSRLIPL